MNRWDGSWTRGPKAPPPERGIRMKKAGTTWWGQRWIEALEQILGGDAGRLARGRTYARAGRTHDLEIHGGKVTAQVTGSRPTPYRITIDLAQLGDAAWTKAIGAMARRAQFSAELLAGEMPRAIDEVFQEANVGLFPRKRADLATSCSCPDWGDPCKHVAATHYVLGEALDRDPFLLFELRGRTKAQVLDALRAARGGVGERRKRSEEAPGSPETAAPEVPAVQLGKVAAADYDRPRAALPALHFSFDPPATHGAVLRQLGTPAAWEGDASPADVLAPLVRAAAETARRIAMAEPEEEVGGVGSPSPSPSPSTERPAGRARSARPKPGRGRTT